MQLDLIDIRSEAEKLKGLFENRRNKTPEFLCLFLSGRFMCLKNVLSFTSLFPIRFLGPR